MYIHHTLRTNRYLASVAEELQALLCVDLTKKWLMNRHTKVEALAQILALISLVALLDLFEFDNLVALKTAHGLMSFDAATA